MAEKQVDVFTFNSLKLLHIVVQSKYLFSHYFFRLYCENSNNGEEISFVT